jgi:hypothetical protein
MKRLMKMIIAVSGKGGERMPDSKNSTEELYEAMKTVRDNYYKTGKIDLDVALFFRLFKAVCDLRTIQRIADSQ